MSDPQLGFVNSYGYVSLFPFLLEILQPDNPKLEIILKVSSSKTFWDTFINFLAFSEPTPIQPPEIAPCDLGYTRVCLLNGSDICGEGMYKFCPREDNGAHITSQGKIVTN